MTVSEAYEIIQSYAPKRISDAYCAAFGAYDNSGILIDSGAEVRKVLFSLDCSAAAAEHAVAEGCDLIVTHHPVIYGKIGSISGKYAKLLRHGISVISMHLNLDCAHGGIDELLMQGLGGQDPVLFQTFEGGAYGRVAQVQEQSFAAFCARVKAEFQTERMLVYGGARTVRRVASFCGAGADEESVLFAARQGADVIVSSDFKHHILTLALEAGLNVVVLTHYASEQYGFSKISTILTRRMGLPAVIHTDDLF